MTSVRAGDLYARNEGGGETGFFILDDGFNGWTSGPGIRREKVAVPQGHGYFAIPGFREGRLLDIAGECLAESPEGLLAFDEQINSVFADGGFGRVLVEHAGTTSWGMAGLADAPDFKPTINPLRATFEIQFWFPKPQKFGESRTFPASGGPATSVEVFHRGNADASAVVTVTGNSPGGYTFWTGETAFWVSAPLVPGHPHVIDLATGAITIDGSRQIGVTPLANLSVVPPKAKTTYTLVLPDGASGGMAITVLDTSL